MDKFPMQNYLIKLYQYSSFKEKEHTFSHFKYGQIIVTSTKNSRENVGKNTQYKT
jgi:hypothetical protein